MTANGRGSPHELARAKRLDHSRRFGCEEKDECALLYCLEPVHQTLIVGGIYPVERESGRVPEGTEDVRVGLFCGVMIVSKDVLMNMRERSFNEAQQQGAVHKYGARETH